MKISILVMITNPEERQDKWQEAFKCYEDFADEVVVVNGGDTAPSMEYLKNHPKIKIVDLLWPYEWNWAELPNHLNAGREQCTGDWIIKLDIDQFLDSKDFETIRKRLADCPIECQQATFQKISPLYGGKYYQKGGIPIAFRNLPHIKIGKNLQEKTDLCFAVDTTGFKDQTEKVDLGYCIYEMPVGNSLNTYRTRVSYWNYDYYFKTKEFTKKEFWRFSKAYQRYYGIWKFGSTEKKSFMLFMGMQKGRNNRGIPEYSLDKHPSYIREAVKNLIPEQLGFNGWEEK